MSARYIEEHKGVLETALQAAVCDAASKGAANPIHHIGMFLMAQEKASNITEYKRAEMVDGFFMHYTDTGESDLPALIMVHAAGSYGTKDYAAHAEALRTVCRVIVVDLRGHGESCHPPAGTCTLSACADDLSKLMEILGLSPSKTILYGMSWGWSIVLTYVRKYGANVKGLICEDMIPVYPPGKVEGYQGFFGPEMAGNMKPVLEKDVLMGMGGFKDFIFPPGVAPDDMVAANWPVLLSNFNLVSAANWITIMEQLGAYDCTDVLPTIKAAKTPSLVMSGMPGLAKADKAKMAEEMGAKLIDFEHSGHFIHVTEAAKSIADMVAFIKSL
mmetsp:Transcript_33772/g.55753  ORF Transcript_33772/g.55753 Transcript_33772/m.55753 type:complete len:330 (-) Transcript_33772:196-1185(-)